MVRGNLGGHFDRGKKWASGIYKNTDNSFSLNKLMNFGVTLDFIPSILFVEIEGYYKVGTDSYYYERPSNLYLSNMNDSTLVAYSGVATRSATIYIDSITSNSFSINSRTQTFKFPTNTSLKWYAFE